MKKKIKLNVLDQLWVVISTLAFLARIPFRGLKKRIYTLWWRRNIKVGDYCTFKDVGTRGQIPLNGRGVGRVMEVRDTMVVVERVLPADWAIGFKPSKLRYLSDEDLQEINNQTMVAGLGFGLRSRGL